MGNGGCTDVCENNIGDFTCSCSQGYVFEPGDDSDPRNVGRLCLGIPYFVGSNYWGKLAYCLKG